jgi:hypothetical protein
MEWAPQVHALIPLMRGQSAQRQIAPRIGKVDSKPVEQRRIVSAGPLQTAKVHRSCCAGPLPRRRPPLAVDEMLVAVPGRQDMKGVLAAGQAVAK